MTPIDESGLLPDERVYHHRARFQLGREDYDQAWPLAAMKMLSRLSRARRAIRMRRALPDAHTAAELQAVVEAEREAMGEREDTNRG